MKAIIDGVRYDTDKATLVGEYWNGLDRSDFNYLLEELYVTPRGNWFVAGTGGARTAYVEVRGRLHYRGSAINPMSPEAAQEWLERSDCVDALEEHFSEHIVDA